MTEYFLHLLLSFLIGFALDCVLGDPRNFPHSINLIGNNVTKIGASLRKRFPQTANGELNAGRVLVAIVCTLSFIIPLGILIIAFKISWYLGIAIQSFMIWQIIAAKSLMKESKKVYYPLKDNNIKEARHALSMIVGRDTENLRETEVTKAAIETVAENTSDGVIAPMIYIFLGGAPLGYLYKAINTMDSIVGYKNEKYLNFGRCAAILDDVANFIPARFSAIMMILGSFICGYDGKNAIRIFRRDRLKHASPNSAQTESVCAGALQIQLAGDAKYFGKTYKKEYIGEPIRAIVPEDILKSHNLMYAATILTVLLICAIWASILFFR